MMPRVGLQRSGTERVTLGPACWPHDRVLYGG
jgi:hypothetical protein